MTLTAVTLLSINILTIICAFLSNTIEIDGRYQSIGSTIVVLLISILSIFIYFKPNEIPFLGKIERSLNVSSNKKDYSASLSRFIAWVFTVLFGFLQIGYIVSYLISLI